MDHYNEGLEDNFPLQIKMRMGFLGVGDKSRNAQGENKVSKKLFKSMNIYGTQ